MAKKKLNFDLDAFKGKKLLYKLAVGGLSLFTIACFAVFVYVGYIVISTPSFELSMLESQESSRIYDANGTLIASLGFDINSSGDQKNVESRTNVPYEDFPQVLVDAIVATEDSRFFEHPGFDVPRIVKAFVTNIVKGKIDQGGSTITQQVIKKGYFRDELKISRKIQEVVLALQAESTLSKEKILELYLNKIYFGNSISAIGVQNASNYYFGKEVTELTLPEAALLAGALNSPNVYDPFVNLKLATQRQHVVLNLMARHGYITSEECEAAKSIPLENLLTSDKKVSGTVQYGAYIDAVIKEVKDRTKLDPTVVPMEIYTYMDISAQKYMDDVQAGKVASFGNDKLQIASTIMESKTGRIIALAGGRDYATGSGYVNRATEMFVQPGSSLKPILAYASAFEELGWSTGHTVTDKPWFTQKADGSIHAVKNVYNEFWGDINLISAIGRSSNTTALYTYDAVCNKIGDAACKEYMKKLGFTDNDWNRLYAIGAWSTGLSPVQLASAYTSIANEGYRSEGHTVDKVVIIDTGEEIEVDSSLIPEQVFSSEAAYMTASLLTTVVDRGYSMDSFQVAGVDVGGKTGTSNWGSEGAQFKIPDGSNKDRWVVSCTPDYVMTTWIGYDWDAKVKGYYPTDAQNQIVLKVNSGALKNVLYKGFTGTSRFEQPATVIQSSFVTGVYPYVLPDSSSIEVSSGLFKKGTQPTTVITPSSINQLSSFTISNNSGKVTLNYAEYSPLSDTLPVSNTYNFDYYNGTEMTTISLHHIDGLRNYMGSVQYGYTVKDRTSGATITSGTLSTNSGEITVSSTNAQVCGYYVYSKHTTTRSNEVCVNVTGNAPTRAINSSLSSLAGVPITTTTSETSLVLSITGNIDGDVYTATITNNSTNAITNLVLDNSLNCNITDLQVGVQYTIKINLVDSNNKTYSKTHTISIT